MQSIKNIYEKICMSCDNPLAAVFLTADNKRKDFSFLSVLVYFVLHFLGIYPKKCG